MLLHEMIKYAKENNFMYGDIYNSIEVDKTSSYSYEKLPILTKKILQEYGENALSAKYMRYPYCDELITMRSSGSTGRYLKIYWDRNDRVMSLMTSWRWRMKKYNITPSDRYVDFYSTHYIGNRFLDEIPPIYVHNDGYVSLSKVGLSQCRMDLYIDFLERFQPNWISIQPSILMMMCRRLDDTNRVLPKSLRYIESTGEPIDKNFKKELSDSMGIAISDFYGCNEVNYIACECQFGHKHILEENVMVEIVSDNGNNIPNGEYGKIVVSGLCNHAMPIIRYDTGDIGRIINDHDCPCGSKKLILDFSGVRADYKIKTANSYLSSAEIIYAIERTNELMNNCIRQYQAAQNAVDSITLKLVLKESYMDWKEAIIKCFLESLKNEDLKRFAWNFDFVDIISPDCKTGKNSYFISNL